VQEILRVEVPISRVNNQVMRKISAKINLKHKDNLISIIDKSAAKVTCHLLLQMMPIKMQLMLMEMTTTNKNKMMI